MTQPHDAAADDTRIIEVYAAANEIDAGAVRAALEQEGIEAKLVGDLVGNAFDLPLDFSGPRIWVHEADAVAARQIIDRLQERLGADAGQEAQEAGEPDSDDMPD